MTQCHIRALVLLLIFVFCDGSNHAHSSGTGHGDDHGHRGAINVHAWLEHIAEYIGAEPNSVGKGNITILLQKLNFVDCKSENKTLCNLVRIVS